MPFANKASLIHRKNVVVVPNQFYNGQLWKITVSDATNGISRGPMLVEELSKGTQEEMASIASPRDQLLLIVDSDAREPKGTFGIRESFTHFLWPSRMSSSLQAHPS